MRHLSLGGDSGRGAIGIGGGEPSRKQAGHLIDDTIRCRKLWRSRWNHGKRTVAIVDSRIGHYHAPDSETCKK